MLKNFAKIEKIRIGTRGSKLALVQADEVKNLIVKENNLEEDQVEIIKIKTSGDKIQDVNLSEIGGKGLFIKELEEALLENKIDIAIHSAKDVPPEICQGTKIAAFSERKDDRDCFVSVKYNSIENLPKNAIVGTSSARRKAALLKIRPDLKIINFRGNVDSRLKKLDENVVDATILAVCGLLRLDKKIEDEFVIDTKKILPAVGQGCLILQIRKDDEKSFEISKKINHKLSEICVSAERIFLKTLKASCKSPIAVNCRKIDDKFHFRAEIFDFDGSNSFKIDEIIDFDDNISQKSQEIAILAAKNAKINAKELLQKICD